MKPRKFRPERTMRVVHITPHDSHVISQVHVRLAFMPSILGASPSKAHLCPTLFIVGIITIDQPLLPTSSHKYVHWKG